MLVGRFEKLLAAVIVVVLIWAGISSWTQRQPRFVQAGVLITQPGRYLAPIGRFVVDIHPVGAHELEMRVSGDSANFGTISTGPFQRSSAWFMCWDERGNLWIFVPEVDDNGCRCCIFESENEFGVRYAGTGGGWDGIPETFLANLPESVKRIHEISQTAHKQ